MKILIIKPSSLGDVIQSLPVLRLLRLHWPESEIYWWLEASLVPLLEGDPDLSGIIAFPRRGWTSFRRLQESWEALRGLRARHLDLAIDLQGLARSGLMSWLANARLTVGLDNPREGRREGAYAAYDLIVPNNPAHRHAVDRYLAVLPALGVPIDRSFEWLPSRERVAQAFTSKWQVGDADWVGLVPGARWETKRWPAEYFVRVVQDLRSTHPDLKFVLLGGNADLPLAETIAQAHPDHCLDLAGKTSLPEMVEWIRATRLVITNDTGPVHVAAALGKPVVSIFGATEPSSTGPYGQLRNVLQTTDLPCVPCLKRTCGYSQPLACLQAVTPVMVCQLARRCLAETEQLPDSAPTHRLSLSRG